MNEIREYKNRANYIINSDNDEFFENEGGYSYAAGQIVYYILSQSGTRKKTHDVIQSFINKQTVGQLNAEITYWFKIYSHAILRYNKKFNRLYAAILSYDKSSNKVDDMFLAGYLSNNILWDKKEEFTNAEEK